MAGLIEYLMALANPGVAELKQQTYGTPIPTAQTAIQPYADAVQNFSIPQSADQSFVNFFAPNTTLPGVSPAPNPQPTPRTPTIIQPQQQQQSIIQTPPSAEQIESPPVPILGTADTFAYNTAAPQMAQLGPETSPLVAALAALGRLGGNVAGALTGRGPAGEMLAPEADQYSNQMYKEQAAKSKALVDFEAKIKEHKVASKQAETLFKLAKDEPDANLRKMTQYMAQNGMTKEASSLLSSAQKGRMMLERQLKLYESKREIQKTDKDYLRAFIQSKPDAEDDEDIAAKMAATGAPAEKLDKLIKFAKKNLIEKTGGIPGVHWLGTKHITKAAEDALGAEPLQQTPRKSPLTKLQTLDSSDPRVQQARKAGYTDAQIIQHLKGKK